MTEKRNCGTCKFSSFNNGTGKDCGSFGVSDCDRYSKWQPIQKAPSFQMTEEEARKLFIDIGISAIVGKAMEGARDHGYIRKSALVELVEEAEWTFENYRDEDNCITIVEALEISNRALQALKKDHPEFGEKK